MLQVNTTGAWSNVMDFDEANKNRTLATSEFMYLASASRCTLRVIVVGGTGALMHCTPGAGWVNAIQH